MPDVCQIPPRPTGSRPLAGPPGPPRPRLNDLTLDDLFKPPAPFAFQPGKVLSPDRAPWIIYVVTHRVTGRCYVGLSVHTLGNRVARHLSNARRARRVRAGGLMEALRTMIRDGRTFAETFMARVVARAVTADEAAVQEARWIEMLGAAMPLGYNQMPPGGLGCVANAQELAVETEPGARTIYRSIYAAIGAANLMRRHGCRPQLDPSVVYARLAAGWTPEEALEYRVHQDGRGTRRAFRIEGQTHTSLSTAAAATGVPVATLRSRLHRQVRRSPGIAVPDVTHDRRLDGLGAAPLLSLPWLGTGETLTAAEFAARTGLPRSTVIYRAGRVRLEQQARRQVGLDPLSPTEVHGRLTTRIDRTSELRLRLPCGECWVGGERELVRRLFAVPELEQGRQERLSEGGIRRRLRLLSPVDRSNPGKVARAFGLHDPDHPRVAEPVPPMLLPGWGSGA